MKPQFVELVLTCGSWQEAQRIVDVLLKKRLIACAKFLPVTSQYNWHGAVESAQEIMLLMESIAANFEKIESEAKKLHSYETMNLQSLPIEQVSSQAVEWLQKELGNSA